MKKQENRSKINKYNSQQLKKKTKKYLKIKLTN